MMGVALASAGPYANHCWKVKRLLIAYFRDNISSKKLSKSIHACHSCSRTKYCLF